MIDIDIELKKNPTGTAQQKGVSVVHGKPHFYTKPQVKAQMDEYILLINQALSKQGIKPPYFKDPVRVTIAFHFQIKQSMRWGTFKASTPDLDNVEKLLLDAMTQVGFWKDDALIVEKHTGKVWSDTAHIRILVEEVEE